MIVYYFVRPNHILIAHKVALKYLMSGISVLNAMNYKTFLTRKVGHILTLSEVPGLHNGESVRCDFMDGILVTQS